MTHDGPMPRRYDPEWTPPLSGTDDAPPRVQGWIGFDPEGVDDDIHPEDEQAMLERHLAEFEHRPDVPRNHIKRMQRRLRRLMHGQD